MDKPVTTPVTPATPARITVSDTPQLRPTRPSDMLEPVRVSRGSAAGTWTEYLVLFLRIMAAVSMLQGIYPWSQVLGIGARHDEGFETHTIAWQTATVFFAVLDLVAAVGLWLAAAWGAVVWLTSVISMAAVELFFPAVYGGSVFIVLIEAMLLGTYLYLAIAAARERP